MAPEQILTERAAACQVHRLPERQRRVGLAAAGLMPNVSADGCLFPVGDMQGYLNLKGYKEFAGENRPEGWNVWLTFVLSPAAPPPPASSRPRVTK